MDKLSNPQIFPLLQISNPLGDIRHAMKASDAGFAGFGEAYFSAIYENAVKGWKQHQHMQLNLVVPVGEVCFYIRDNYGNSVGKWTIGTSNYARLTVPPGFWVAFRGVGAGSSVVMNLASIEHSPTEARTLPLGTFPLDITE